MRRTVKLALVFAAAAFLLAAYPTRTPALGTESFGNKPLHDPSYEEWPNLTPLINHKSRIYQYWVNGGEKFFFRGNTDALNAALQQFAFVKADARELVLLPGPATVSSLQGESKFAYDWCLEINSGLSRMLARGKGGLIWSKDPRLTIFVGGGNIVLDKIRVPKGITVLELADLRRQYTEAIQESGDIAVRGCGACMLARLDPFGTNSVAVVTRQLEDTNDWIRLNALFALGSLGKAAAPSVPALRRIAETSTNELKQESERTIAAIEAQRDVPAADSGRSALLEKIGSFRRSLPQGK